VLPASRPLLSSPRPLALRHRGRILAMGASANLVQCRRMSPFPLVVNSDSLLQLAAAAAACCCLLLLLLSLLPPPLSQWLLVLQMSTPFNAVLSSSFLVDVSAAMAAEAKAATTATYEQTIGFVSLRHAVWACTLADMVCGLQSCHVCNNYGQLTSQENCMQDGLQR